MKIGIVGLGLIGGSLAKAYKRVGETVFGTDKNHIVESFAEMAEAIDGKLNEDTMKDCDCIFIAVPPKQAVAWLTENAPHMTENNLVIDCCGTKRYVCEQGFALAEKYGFTFAGGHPMAGLQYGGFKNSRYDLYDNAVFALVPKDFSDIRFLERVKEIILPAGFSKVQMTTADSHDETIAFTSQMAHVVSNAFIKSDTAMKKDTAISAGSYRDFTRVAYLDAEMWAELFMENRDNLGHELDVLIEELKKYRKTLDEENMEELTDLLKEGRDCKSEVEKRCNLKC